MSSSTFFKNHPRIALLLFNIILLLLVFIGFEIGLRIFTPDWLAYRMKILKSGNLAGFGTDANWKIKYKNGEFYSFTPNSIFKIYHFEYENTVHTDKFGGRCTDINEKTDTNNIIPFIGDSFVMGVGVEDTESMVSITKKATHYNFLNLGIAGTSLPIQRKLINIRYQEFGRPKIVIYGFCLGNDFDDIMKEYAKIPTAAKQTSSSLQEKEDTNRQISHTSFIWKLNSLINHNNILKRIYVLQFIKQKILNIQNKNKEMYTPFYLFDSHNTAYIKKAKEQIDKEIEILSNEPYKSLIILIPDKYQINDSLRKNMSAYYNLNEKYLLPFLPNQILIEALNKYKIKYIDPTKCLINRQHEGNLFYILDNHLTKFGQRVLSECITDSLKKIIQEYNFKPTK